jgi:putative ABC transport system permease protein
LPQLRIKGNVVFDRLSREIYGEVRSGGEITLNNRPHTVVGSVEIGPGAWIDGYVIMADVSMENRAVDKINLGLIRVRPGVDLQALKARLLASLPDDILIMTPEEARVREVDFTTEKAPTGAVFSAGVAIGFLIGVILCYQILYNEITDHLPQYATMKAMGFSRRFMIRLVVKQALLLSILGFIPGLAGGYLLYALIEHYTQILMMLTLWRGLLVLALTVFMCTFAGFLAARKVLNADPAELY